jgi:uncharacterized membrane protein
MTARSVNLLHAGLLVAFWAACVLVWPQLPERVPHHFGIGGQPTSWARTSVFSWFGLPAMAVVMWGFVYGMTRLGETNPSLWNIPHKERFLRLSPEQRGPVLAELHAVVAWVALCVTVMFAAIQVAVYDTATERVSGFAWYAQLPMWGAMIALFAVPIAYMPRVRRRIEEVEATQDEPPPRRARAG